MNKILEKIIESRGGHYCHCVEVSDVYELEVIAESIFDEYFEEYGKKEVVDFLESLSVYSLNDINENENENENEIYDFSFTEFVNELS